jgi:hypothetical protein
VSVFQSSGCKEWGKNEKFSLFPSDRIACRTDEQLTDNEDQAIQNLKRNQNRLLFRWTSQLMSRTRPIFYAGSYFSFLWDSNPYLSFVLPCTEVSLSHTIRRKVGLLWTSDQPVAKASNYTEQHNI